MKNSLGNFQKVEQLEGNNGGVRNQFIITTDRGTVFQSYNSIIAFMGLDGSVLLDLGTWDYSVTTGKYRNIFLGENKAETKRKIKSGEYVLTDLN
jgi:hypothetical protein